MYLTVQNATKRYGSFTALDDVSLSIEQGEFVCLLGPSGCGKTTLLRLIAGLADLDQGEITLEGQRLTHVPARQRGFGIVFQSYSLFPNMTIAENIGYGLKIRGVSEGRIGARVQDLLQLIKLRDIGRKYPGQLSGGQQQRVALARAIAVDPRVLLLDEPLSALDAKVRGDLRDEILALQRSLGIPTLMVTHDQEEAMAMADKIICMNHGVIVQAGSPQELYHRPATRFVADFMGVSNLIPTAQVARHLPHLMASRPQGAEGEFDACIRPEAIALIADAAGPMRVGAVSFLGNLSRVRLTGPLGEIIVECHGALDLAPDQPVALTISPEECVWVAHDCDGNTDGAGA